jgi:hypothetical protein
MNKRTKASIVAILSLGLLYVLRMKRYHSPCPSTNVDVFSACAAALVKASFISSYGKTGDCKYYILQISTSCLMA